MNLKDKARAIIPSRTQWTLLVALLLVGASLVLVMAPARATHVSGHMPLELIERVELGAPGKNGALFIYCDNGYRVWVATTPDGYVSAYAASASGVACQAPPFVIKP